MAVAEDWSLGETKRSFSFLLSVATLVFGDTMFVDFIPLKSQSFPTASFVSVLAGPLTNARPRQTLLENVEWMQPEKYIGRLFWGPSSPLSKGRTEMKERFHPQRTCPPAPWLLLSNEHGGWWIFSGKIVEDIWPSFLSDAAEMSL